MRSVVITGAGVVSAMGDTPETFFENLCLGLDRFQPVQNLEQHGLENQVGIGLPEFDPMTYLGDQNFRPLDRTGRLSVVAASLALESAGWSADLIGDNEVGLFLGTLFCGLKTIMEFDRSSLTLGPKFAKPMDFANTVINAAAGQTALWHNLRGVNSTVASGSVSGLSAIIQAAEAIGMGQGDVLLAGGAEEMCFESLLTFDRSGLLTRDRQNRPLPFASDRQGFAHGEGAAFLVLEEREYARRRGARILAEIRGFATGFDSSRGRDLNRGSAAVASTLKRALSHGGVGITEVDSICVSANGGVHQDRIEAEALTGVFGPELPAITAPKSMLGECFGAGGAFQALAMVASMTQGRLPGIPGLTGRTDLIPQACFAEETRAFNSQLSLVNGVGYDGINSCLLLAAPDTRS